jgi:hypothetical protein
MLGQQAEAVEIGRVHAEVVRNGLREQDALSAKGADSLHHGVDQISWPVCGLGWIHAF